MITTQLLEDRTSYTECKGYRGRCNSECTHSIVYFIQEDGAGPIKIGHGWKVIDRLRGLQAGNPRQLHILATMRGGKAMEKELHARFKHLRIRGEWFQAGRELLSFIESVHA